MFVRNAAAAVVMLVALGVATPALGQSAAITANSTVQGRIEPTDARVRVDGYNLHGDVYTYEGEAGEELRISISSSMIHLRISGPGNFSADDIGDRISTTLPTRGRYRISVAYSSATVPSIDYQLSVLRINTAQTPTALTIGQTIQGGISVNDSVGEYRDHYDTYTLDVAVGDIVAFRLNSEGTEGRVYISGPGLMSNYPGRVTSNYPAAQGEYFYFSTAGQHQIKISGAGGGDTGNYTLELVRGQSAYEVSPSAALAVGETVQVSAQGAVVNRRHKPVGIYTLSARRGDRVALLLTPYGGIGAEVIAPDGQSIRGEIASTSIAEPGTFTFQTPVDGEYRVLVEAGETRTIQLTSAGEGAAAFARADADRRARVAQLMQRGEQLLNSGANSEAEQVFGQVIALDYRNAAAHNSVGVAQLRQGSFSTAQLSFEYALRYDPNNQLARTNLQLAQQAQVNQARQDAQQQADFERQMAESRARSERERQQSDAAAIGNAIGTFTGAYNATVEAQQAQAAAQAQAAQQQADAQAAANARAAQQAAPTQTSTPPPYEGVANGGHNNCAVLSGGRLYNNCTRSISAVIEYESGSQDNIFVAGGPTSESMPRTARRVILSCYSDGRGGAFRSGDGWVCR